MKQAQGEYPDNWETLILVLNIIHLAVVLNSVSAPINAPCTSRKLATFHLCLSFSNSYIYNLMGFIINRTVLQVSFSW